MSLTGVATKPAKSTVLEGPNIRMEPMKIEYADELYACTHQSEESAERLWAYMFHGPFSSADDMRQMIQQTVETDDMVAFVIIDKKSNKKIGQMVYMNIVPQHKTIEIGSIYYSPDFQRTYANTESVLLALTHAFEVLGFRRMEWKCNSENQKSRNAALGLGFKYEGIFRQHMIIKGKNRDTAWFSVIDSEWPQVKQQLQDRLEKYKQN
jgi:RimJ/RimL family protein N-acetyltransferase